MVNIIVNKIVADLKIDLPFVDKITGIVKAAQIDVAGAVKTLPVAINTDVTTCNDSELVSYEPDTSNISIIYFAYNFTLVCWFNYLKVDHTLTNTSQIVGNLIKYLPEIMGNIAPLIGVVLSINGEQAKDGSVFSKYTYIENVTQFITYPYDYVALDLSAEFHVRKDCFNDIVLNPAVC
jgi:hypothetical protein